MAKKLSLLLAAVAVLAFAVPAFASAATGLTEGGALIPTGKIITGTNSGNVQVTSTKTGTLKCANVMIEAKLTTNTTSLVEAGPGGTNSATTCTNASGATISVANIAVTSLKSTGGGTGTASLSFEITLPSGTVCKYTGSGTATYNTTETTAGGNVLTITKQPLSVTPAACGTTAELDGVFKLSTQGSSTFNVFLM